MRAIWIEIWLDRYFARHWRNSWDGLTSTPVPFKLPPIRVGADRQGFAEHAVASQRTAVISCAFTLILGLFLLVAAIILRAWPPVIGAAIFLLFSLWLIILYRLAARKTRYLWINAPTMQVHLERVDPRNKLIEQAVEPLEKCWLRIHQVTLVVYRTRSGQPAGSWRGHAAVVQIRDQRFVLACQKNRDQVESYISNSPRWVRTILSGDGEPIEASAHLRLI